MALPLVSLSAGADGSLAAATPDAIYWRAAQGEAWQPVAATLRNRLGDRLIQVICYQIAENGAGPAYTFWVGTSRGLFAYRPVGAGLLDSVQGELEQLSIQSMAIDTLTGRLWVGTPRGLFSEHRWQRHREADVRALAFGPGPHGELWIGTDRQLERWHAPGKGEVFQSEPAALFASSDFGAQGSAVTSLTVRLAGDNEREVWIGSPTGVSCYRYGP